jgi:hypothetical protein
MHLVRTFVHLEIRQGQGFLRLEWLVHLTSLSSNYAQLMKCKTPGGAIMARVFCQESMYPSHNRSSELD